MSTAAEKEHAKRRRIKERAKEQRHRDKAAQRQRRKNQRSLWQRMRREHITGGLPAYHDSQPREERFPPGSKVRTFGNW